MANIRQLSSGNWNAQVRLAGMRPRSQTFHSRKEAEDWAAGLEGVARYKHPSFKEAGLTYAKEILGGRPSKELFELQIIRLGRRPMFRKPIHNVSAQDLIKFKNQRLSEVTTTTVRDDMVKAMRVIRWYIAEWKAMSGEEIADPCQGITLPRPRRTRDHVVTRDQLAQLLTAMSPEMAVVVELAYETAMRRSELLRLRAQDLNLAERFLRVVDGKEGSRDVPLSRRAVELLAGALACACDTDSPLFPVAAYSVTQAVRRAREKVGLSNDVRFHQLRHSRITEVARKGLNQAQIMIVSGHRDIRSVQRYTHLNVRDVVDLID